MGNPLLTESYVGQDRPPASRKGGRHGPRRQVERRIVRRRGRARDRPRGMSRLRPPVARSRFPAADRHCGHTCARDVLPTLPFSVRPGADVAAPLAARGRRSAPWRAAFGVPPRSCCPVRLSAPAARSWRPPPAPQRLGPAPSPTTRSVSRQLPPLFSPSWRRFGTEHRSTRVAEDRAGPSWRRRGRYILRAQGRPAGR